MRLQKWITTAIAGLLITAGRAEQSPLRAVGTITLQGVSGRIDHLAVDRERHRLFVAALGNNSIEELDVSSLSSVRSGKGASEPQGVAYLADLGQIAVANGQAGDVQFRDAANLRVLHTVPLGDDADNVRYDSRARRVYIGYGAGALAGISPSDGKRVADVKLPGHPESFQLETSGPRIFVNVPSAARIVVVDRDAMKVIASWPVTLAGANYPMALDEPGHRLYIGCRRPAKVLVYDTESGKLAASADTVGDADDLFFDGARSRLYVSGGQGFVHVLQIGDGSITELARVPTAPGARTSLFVPEQNRLYVAVPRGDGHDAEVRVFDVQG